MREKMIEAIKRMPRWVGLKGAVEVFADCLLAVDVVPVVRCKDCAFCKVDNLVYMRDVFGNENDTPRYHCLMGYGYNKPNHFCSYGEKMDGGNEDG